MKGVYDDNEEYILNGTRGVVVFLTYSIKSDRQKALHIDLYSRNVIEYYDKVKRTFSCDDIYSINRPIDNNCLIGYKLICISIVFLNNLSILHKMLYI